MKHLDLSRNRLGDLPTFATLTALTSLDLGGNAFHTLPTSIGALPHLKHLDLSDNRLDDLPALAALTALTSLDLGNNAFRVLPTSIGALSHLRSLHLYNNPELRDFPKAMSCLTSLTELDVSAAGFGDRPDGAFPSALFKLTALTTLDASDCGVRTVLGIRGLVALTSLDLDNCRVREVDDEISGKLEQLGLSGNGLRRFPGPLLLECAFAHLSDVNISDNPGVLDGASEEAIAWLVRHKVDIRDVT